MTALYRLCVSGRLSCLLLLALLGLCGNGAANALVGPVGPVSDTMSVLQTRAQMCSGCRSLSFERSILVDDVAHYQWTLQVGPSELDRIRLHRVVRETSPWWPQRSRDSIMLTHGARTGFAGTFLSTVGPEGLDPAHNLAVYLAQRDVDVWGFDMRWSLVPQDATDLSPLADWGMARDAADLGIALRVARFVRLLGGNGRGKMGLLGFSYGGRVAYAYLESEVDLPRWRRQVSRYVALEGLFKTAQAQVQQDACELIDVLQGLIDSGDVATTSAVISQVGQLALTAPDDPSPFPFANGLTNRQTALVFGTQPASAGLLPLHAFAGVFQGPLPVGLRFTAERAGINLFASASGFSPRAGVRDLMIVLCDDGRSTLDDRLDEVTVPVLYIGAAGGFAENGLDTFPFLGSTETESLILAFNPPDQTADDVGHADVVMMDTADDLVWEPIFDWITNR